MTEEKKGILWVKSPDGVCEVYGNIMHITWSLDDVRIRIGQLVDSPETPYVGTGEFRSVAQERAAITLTWRTAQILRDQLTTLLESFEKANGPIKLQVELVSAPI